MMVPTGPPDGQVPVCHWNNGGGGGWELVTVDGAGLNGHYVHGRDIIPPNDFGPPLNWDAAGIPVWEAGCEDLPGTGGAVDVLLMGALVLAAAGLAVWLIAKGGRR